VPETNKETFPAWQIAQFTFPGTKYTAEKTINGAWCNGPKQPSRDLVPMPPPDYSGPLTETVQLGNLATNFPNQTLNWDAQEFKISTSTKNTETAGKSKA